jgi:hypothetical protein
VFTLPTLLNGVFEFLPTTIRQGEEIKESQIRKEEIKLPYFQVI